MSVSRALCRTSRKYLQSNGAVDAEWNFRIYGFRLRVCRFSPSLCLRIASSAAERPPTLPGFITYAGSKVC